MKHFDRPLQDDIIKRLKYNKPSENNYIDDKFNRTAAAIEDSPNLMESSEIESLNDDY